MRRIAILVMTGAALAGNACHRAPPEPPDTLVILQERDAERLDPHTGGNLWQTQTVLANLYEGLVALDDGMRVVPALATEWNNPDDTTLELALRPDVSFHDGTRLTVEDVLFSLERARTHPKSLLKSALAAVQSVEAVAGRVRIRLREPDAAFVSRLRDVGIVSRACVERVGEAGLERASCGTGAYRLVARVAGRSVDLERFPAYWGGEAEIRRAQFVAAAFGDPALQSQLGPRTRLVFYARPGIADYARIQHDFVLHRGSGLGVSYVGFDLRGPQSPAVTLPDGSHRNPFLDRRVREAVALAVDRAQIDQAVYGGDAVVASQFVPGVVFGFDRALPPPRHDVAAARRLLAATPFADGFEVRLDVRSIMERYAEPLRASLAGAGIKVKPELLDDDEFFRRVRGGQSSLYVLRFSCRSGDAQELLDKWVHSKDPARGLGSSNHSYDQAPLPGLDEAIDGARRELKPELRLKLVSGVLARVEEEHLVVPLMQDLDLTYSSPDLEWHARADTYRIIREARFR